MNYPNTLKAKKNQPVTSSYS